MRANSECCKNTTRITGIQTRENSNTSLGFAVLHELYSEHIFRKPIRKTHTRRNVEKRKRLNFCGMKDEMMTNKLEYYVPESERALRALHLMFDHANSPDRMSILLKASLYIQTLLTECDCCSKNQSRSGL